MKHVFIAIFLTAVAVSGVSAQAKERIALVIGNAAYEQMSPLGNPKRDAKAMAELLRSHDVKVVEGYDLKIGEFYELIARFRRQASDADVVFVYYAGHGMQSDGRDVLAPVDVSYQCPEDQGRASIYGGISLEEALRGLGRETATQVVMIDACRNKPLKTCPTRSVTDGLSFSFRALGRLGGAARSVMVANATQPGGLSADGPAGAHSPFNRALRSALEDHPRRPLRDVLDLAAAKVKRDTRSKQIPQVTTNGGAPRLCISSEGCDDGASGTLVPSDDQLAARVWDTIRDSDSKVALNTFLNQFPDSAQSNLARARLQELEEAERQSLVLTNNGLRSLESGALLDLRSIKDAFPEYRAKVETFEAEGMQYTEIVLRDDGQSVVTIEGNAGAIRDVEIFTSAIPDEHGIRVGTPVADMPKNALKDCFPGVEAHADKIACGFSVSPNIQYWFDNNDMSAAHPKFSAQSKVWKIRWVDLSGY
jgi:hypothetical protein